MPHPAPAPPPPDLPKVFLSYAEWDYRNADRFKRALEASLTTKGYALPTDYVFLARKSIRKGARWFDVIPNAILQRGVFVLLVSPRSLASDWCLRREAWMAWQRKRLLLPVILDGRRPFSWLNPYTWTRNHDDWKEHQIRASDDEDFATWCIKEDAHGWDFEGSTRISDAQAIPSSDRDGRVVEAICHDHHRLMKRAADEVAEEIIRSASEPTSTAAEGGRLPSDAIFGCDHETLENAMRVAWQQAAGMPLLFFLQGQEDDLPGRLWNHRFERLWGQFVHKDAAPHVAALKININGPDPVQELKDAFAAHPVGAACPPTPRVYRWEIGADGSRFSLRRLQEVMCQLKGFLAEHPSPPGSLPDAPVRAPSIIVSVLLHSNVEEPALREAIDAHVPGVHAKCLTPGNWQMLPSDFQAWFEARLKDAVPERAQSAFRNSATRLHQQLVSYDSRPSFRTLLNHCRKYHLIHES